jgi:hypothetical protein
MLVNILSIFSQDHGLLGGRLADGVVHLAQHLSVPHTTGADSINPHFALNLRTKFVENVLTFNILQYFI